MPTDTVAPRLARHLPQPLNLSCPLLGSLSLAGFGVRSGCNLAYAPAPTSSLAVRSLNYQLSTLNSLPTHPLCTATGQIVRNLRRKFRPRFSCLFTPPRGHSVPTSSLSSFPSVKSVCTGVHRCFLSGGCGFPPCVLCGCPPSPPVAVPLP